jgi:hypothetical protein
VELKLIRGVISTLKIKKNIIFLKVFIWQKPCQISRFVKPFTSKRNS